MRRQSWPWAPPISRPCSGSACPLPAAASPPPWCWASAGPSARPWPSSWWRATWPICPACSTPVRFLTTAIASRDVLRLRGLLHRQALFSIGLVLFLFIMLINVFAQRLHQAEEGGLTRTWNLMTLSPRRQLYDRGLRVLLYLCALPHLRAAGVSSSAISSTGACPIITLGAAVHPVQLSSTTPSASCPISSTPCYIIVLYPGHRAAPGRGRRHLSDGVRHATSRLVAVIEFATETLTGIPSIIYRPGGHAVLLPAAGTEDLHAGRRPDPGDHDPAHHRPHHPGEPEDRAPVLPGGRPGPGRRQVAHGPHRGAAQRGGRHRHRLHPGRGPHCGRVARPCCTPPAFGMVLNNFC